jgi:hypothetical protein
MQGRPSKGAKLYPSKPQSNGLKRGPPAAVSRDIIYLRAIENLYLRSRFLEDPFSVRSPSPQFRMGLGWPRQRQCGNDGGEARKWVLALGAAACGFLELLRRLESLEAKEAVKATVESCLVAA